MASTAIDNNPLKQLGNLSQLNIVRQVVLMVLLAAGIALGLAVVLWSRTPDYSALYLDMSVQDSNEVIAALEQQGVEYRLAGASGIITVPADQVHQIRLQLASQGLPRSSAQGYDILDQEQALGTSNFIEQARYNRALEQELVKTIKQLRGVREARVHLSIPKQSSFIRNSRKPSASVMLDLQGAQSLSETQLAGILHLVSSSVSELVPDNVSIIDQQGNLLSSRGDSQISGSSETIRLTRGIEQDYIERIISILTPIVGEGNVRAQVNAEVDYQFVETTRESYDPESRTVRSEQTQREVNGSSDTGNLPGTLAQTPPQEGEEEGVQAEENGTTRTRVNATRNYEIGRSVSHIRSVPGGIERLSVAVLVNLPAPGEPGAGGEAAAPSVDPALRQQRLDRITQLVRDTIGYNAERGDSVNVVSEQFSPVQPLPPLDSPSLLQQDWVLPALKQALAGIVVLLLIFVVFRPAVKSVVTLNAAPALPGANHKNARPAALAGQGQERPMSDDQVSLSGEQQAAPKAPPPKSPFDENLDLAQSLVEMQPVRAARMIKEWVASDQ